MRRAPCLLGLGGAAAIVAFIGYHTVTGGVPPAPPRQEGEAPSSPLPIAQVVLFNSGVGYFQREGAVAGDARIDLAFPAEDINDLLKSLVLRDLGSGSIDAVSYDSHEPIERTLKSFALDLTGNPSFGQILNQTRGEKVEVALQNAGVTATAGGTVVGMESQPDGAGKEIHLLNLLAADGLRAIPLTQVQRIRFLNPALDAEFHGALRVLAAAHDTKKKMVHLHFKGAGKRPVRVGYVIESPMWKSTYRLIFDKNGNPKLQSWAVIENTTDEDWKDIRLALVSGRPLTFEMDLYRPLFVPRPKVEPELFASLRPPAYSGALVSGGLQLGGNQLGMQIGGFGGLGGQVAIGGLPGNLPGAANLGVGGGGFGGGQFSGAQLGQFGNLGGFNRYQPGGFQAGGGFQGGFQGGSAQMQNTAAGDNAAAEAANRLTYEELQRRRQEQKKARQDAQKFGNVLAAIDPKDVDAEAGEVGDNLHHILEQKVSLARQKSAPLPLLDKEVQGKRVSIFNEAVHARLPLLGLKFKNTTGKPLMQGPLVVFEADRYAGDARILDLQPDEERLIAFGMDLGVEVKSIERQATGPRITVRTLKNELETQYTVRKTRTLLLRNRTKTDRLMVVEHPIVSDWAIAGQNKPAERARDHYRFEVDLLAGQAKKFEIAEEQVRIVPFGQPYKAFKEGDQLVQHFAVPNLGIEVERVTRPDPAEIVGAKVSGGQATSLHRQVENLTYRVRNVSELEREVTIEHQTPGNRTFVGELKPIPGSTDRYVFHLKVAPGKVVEQALQERGLTSRIIKLTELDEEHSQPLLSSAAVKDRVKAVLRAILKQRGELEKFRRAASEAEAALKAIVDEQGRLRANLERLPPPSAAYKRYLEKFDKQETQIEKLQGQLDEVNKAFKSLQKEHAEFIAKAKAD